MTTPADVEFLEKEIDLAKTRLKTMKTAYKLAKMRLGHKEPDERELVAIEIREKSALFKSKIVRNVLEKLAKAILNKNAGDSQGLIDLDDKLYLQEK